MSTRTARQPPAERPPGEHPSRRYGDVADDVGWVRDVGPVAGPSVYWRRRFIALVIGLAVLAVVAWALNGAIAGPAPAADSSGANAPDNPGTGAVLRPSTGATPGSVASQGSASKGGASKGSAAPAASSSASRAPGRSPTPRAPASSHPAVVHHGPPQCVQADVVLSLFSAQANYAARQTPEFNIDVVSTADHTCMFNIGASHLVLRVTKGSKQIWTSADCAEGQASLVTRLRRGIPTTVPITWDGQRSAPGCPVPGAAAAPGVYTATASDGQLSSNSLQFRIG